jgi:hypothetical protein
MYIFDKRMCEHSDIQSFVYESVCLNCGVILESNNINITSDGNLGKFDSSSGVAKQVGQQHSGPTLPCFSKINMVTYSNDSHLNSLIVKSQGGYMYKEKKILNYFTLLKDKLNYFPKNILQQIIILFDNLVKCIDEDLKENKGGNNIQGLLSNCVFFIMGVNKIETIPEDISTLLGIDSKYFYVTHHFFQKYISRHPFYKDNVISTNIDNYIMFYIKEFSLTFEFKKLIKSVVENVILIPEFQKFSDHVKICSLIFILNSKLKIGLVEKQMFKNISRGSVLNFTALFKKYEDKIYEMIVEKNL